MNKKWGGGKENRERERDWKEHIEIAWNKIIIDTKATGRHCCWKINCNLTYLIFADFRYFWM